MRCVAALLCEEATTRLKVVVKEVPMKSKRRKMDRRARQQQQNGIEAAKREARNEV